VVISHCPPSVDAQVPQLPQTAVLSVKAAAMLCSCNLMWMQDSARVMSVDLSPLERDNKAKLLDGLQGRSCSTRLS